MLFSSSLLQPGSPAPDFTLPDQNGNPVRLHALLQSGPVVLYFYPKDDTPVCTREACEFRDRNSAFAHAGAHVLGVSDDSVERHRAFERRHGLPFLLLSDADGVVRRLYGVKKLLGLVPGRATFVIDQSGTIVHVFASPIAARRHVDEALRAIENIRASRPAQGEASPGGS